MKHIETTTSYGKLRKRVYSTNDEPSKADPSQAPECDINNIMHKFGKTGHISHFAKHQGMYADLTEISDLHSAMIQVTQAQQAFDALPSELRTRFGNSPIEMVNFLQNSQNKDEAIKLGLIPKPLEVPTKRTFEEEPTSTTQPKSQKLKTKTVPNDDD